MTLSMASNTVLKNWLQVSSVRITRVRFVLIAVFIINTIAADAWNLIPPGNVLQRWTLIAAIAIANTLFWYASRGSSRSGGYYKALIYGQIVMDILVISLLIYSQRGIASLAVALYAVPLISSAVLLTRSALFATATLCASAYALSSIRYQFLHPGESYKVELYAELFLYGALFFVLAALLHIVIRSKK